jgi:hypothetical protein
MIKITQRDLFGVLEMGHCTVVEFACPATEILRHY